MPAKMALSFTMPGTQHSRLLHLFTQQSLLPASTEVTEEELGEQHALPDNIILSPPCYYRDKSMKDQSYAVVKTNRQGIADEITDKTSAPSTGQIKTTALYQKMEDSEKIYKEQYQQYVLSKIKQRETQVHKSNRIKRVSDFWEMFGVEQQDDVKR
eukprot:14469881-Ditylum_brightwellii.AAC.1